MVMVPQDDILGPAMRVLTEGQRAFVIAHLLDGGRNNTQAAIMAGYGGTPESARTRAFELMRTPKILAAIREEADRRLRSGAALAASALLEMAADPMHKDRYKASVELLNRAGMVVEDVKRVIHEDYRSNAEIKTAILALAKANNLDIKALGIAEEPLEAEFEELSSDGIEDLLA